MGGFWILLLAVAVIGSIALVSTLYNQHVEKKRAEDLRYFAQSIGFEVRADLAGSLLATFSGLPIFAEGRSKAIRNLLHASDGTTETMIFDYKYVTGSGKSSHTSHFTVAMTRSPRLNLPKFSLQPEHLGHRILAAFGMQDIDFSDHPQFSRAYLLRGPEEELRAVFHDDVVTWFEGQPNLIVQGDGHDLVVTRSKAGKTPIGEIRDLFDTSFQLYSLLKQG